MTPDSWAGVVRAFDDASLYQTWAYGATRWTSAALSHLVVWDASEPVGAAQIRLLRCPYLPGGIAYVRWGPLWRRRKECPEAHNLAEVLRALREEYVQRRGFLLRLLPRVFHGEGDVPVQKVFADEHFVRRANRSPYATFVLDLAPPLDELSKKLDKHWRKHLRQAEDAQINVAEGTGDELFSSLDNLYQELRGRKHFAAFVKPEELRRMQALLPDDQKMQLVVCRFAGLPVSAAVFSALGDTGLCLLAATGGEGRRVNSSYLAKWKTVEWMQKHGCRWLDLGGRGGDVTQSVDKFKAGMSGLAMEHVGEYEACSNRLSLVMMRVGDLAQAIGQRWMKWRACRN
jgi:hypothetical protein